MHWALSFLFAANEYYSIKIATKVVFSLATHRLLRLFFLSLWRIVSLWDKIWENLR